jgi:hypothetical protein
MVFALAEKTGWTPDSLSMLLASSRQKPIHGEVNVSPKFSTARRKGSDLTLIKLSGVLQGLPFAVRRRPRHSSSMGRSAVLRFALNDPVISPDWSHGSYRFYRQIDSTPTEDDDEYDDERETARPYRISSGDLFRGGGNNASNSARICSGI